LGGKRVGVPEDFEKEKEGYYLITWKGPLQQTFFNGKGGGAVELLGRRRQSGLICAGVFLRGENPQ